MDQQPYNTEYLLFFVVVNLGKGSKVIKECKKLGVPGGTIFFGKGTIKNNFLEILGIDEIKKEIVMMLVPSHLEDITHIELTRKFKLNLPNSGIAFSSLPIKSIFGLKNSSYADYNICKEDRSDNIMVNQVLFTIVDRGLAEDVVNAAVAAGADGATIINGRGDNIHENITLFSMPFEPEKEIIMILIDKLKINSVMDSINKKLQSDEFGNVVMFSIDINKTSGLSSKDSV